MIFTYQRNAEKAKEYTITVIDKYITDIPMSNFIIDESDKSGISDGLNTFNTYHYAKENGQYVYMVRRELRCRDIYTEGSAYIYNALDLRHYTCISDNVYSGVVNGDMELEFIYARNGLKVQDIPYNVYNSKPDYLDAPEAKTGDLDEVNKLPHIIVVILLAGIGVAAYIGRKRQYK